MTIATSTIPPVISIIPGNLFFISDVRFISALPAYPAVLDFFILIRPLLLHLAFKVMNGICYISTKRNAKLLHYFMIIVFHPLVYPVKHNSNKSILVKVCYELLIILRKIIPCAFLIHYIRYELIL